MALIAAIVIQLLRPSPHREIPD